ncbi:MAG: hypothetical protein JW731_06075 [Bacteroidales bacterium]|nr:hypothetical protein [Bacteroidales bacterium]
MDKRRMKKMARNPNQIAGIYNYCDGWCKRCPFTSRCLTFAMEQEDPLKNDLKANDIENKEFWDRIGENFRLTLEMLYDDANRLSIDLNAIPEDTELNKMLEDRHDAARNHPLTKKATQYMHMVDDWFKGSKGIFTLKADELQKKMVIELINKDPVKDLESIQEAVDIIKWYFMQIGVKLSRAFSGRYMDEVEGWNLDGEFPRDSDGSAKVSLIGIDRSISAWGSMLKQLPDEENQILDMLVFLEKLRKQIEAEFPDARAFKRPGFDD